MTVRARVRQLSFNWHENPPQKFRALLQDQLRNVLLILRLLVPARCCILAISPFNHALSVSFCNHSDQSPSFPSLIRLTYQGPFRPQVVACPQELMLFVFLETFCQLLFDSSSNQCFLHPFLMVNLSCILWMKPSDQKATNNLHREVLCLIISFRLHCSFSTGLVVSADIHNSSCKD